MMQNNEDLYPSGPEDDVPFGQGLQRPQRQQRRQQHQNGWHHQKHDGYQQKGVEVFVRNLDGRSRHYTIISSTTTDDLAELFKVPPGQVYFVYQGTRLTNATLHKVPRGGTIHMMGRLRGG